MQLKINDILSGKQLTFGLLAFFMLNLLQSVFTPITEDEAYYWMWSQQLDFGYFDHPPMISWWIAAGNKILAGELGVRIFTVIFNTLGIYLLWKTLNPKNKSQSNLFWLITASVAVIQLFGFLATPDAPLLFFTLLYLYSLKGFLEKNSNAFMLLLAISFAGLMYSKYHGFLVILFTLIPIAGLWMKNYRFYLAVIISLILYLPHFIWLFQNDFIPVQYHFIERSSDEQFDLLRSISFLGMFFLGCAPLLSHHILKSLVKFKAESNFQRSIWWLPILPGLFFFISTFKDKVQPHWLLISFLAMALIFYWYYSADEKSFKWIFKLGIANIILILLVRIGLAIPSISPLYKNKEFGLNAGKFNPENAVFEKYQEASVFKFYNPDKNTAVHRTLGNRRSQYSLWGTEEDFQGKEVTYISPWIRADDSFIGYKNRAYFLKNIPNYQPFDKVKIIAKKELSFVPNEVIGMKIQITNGHSYPITIGKDSEFVLTINYYQRHQYEIDYSTEIPIEQLTLNSNESKDLEVEWKNTPEKGNYKVCFGLNYLPIGTSYVSDVMKNTVQ